MTTGHVAVNGTSHGTQSPAGPAASLFVKRRDSKGADAEMLRRPSISYWQDARMRLAKNKTAIGSGIFILCLAVAAVVVPELLPYTYDEQEVWNKHALPSLGEEALVVDEATIAYTPIEAAPAPEAGEDPNASAIPDTTAISTDPPPAPANVRLMKEALTTGVQLQWDAVAGVEGYRIFRSISDDTLGVPIEDVGPDRLSALDAASLSAGVTYYYFVTAFNAFGDSPDAKPMAVTPKLALPLEVARTIDPDAINGSRILTRPHYLGTDHLGRDMLARVMMGSRISLAIGFGAPLLYVLFGIIYGSIAGYFGGLVDDVMMRITDVVSTVPELLVVITLQVVLGSGMTTLIVAICSVSWARSARQIRGEVLRLRETEFVQAAKVLGTSFPKIVGRHLLPNVMGTVLVFLTLAVPQAIFTEAFLSFIGLGIQPPMASWGTVTKEGARVFLTYPHELIIPSALICVTMLAFNLLGDGLRDALDPKLRGAK